MTHQNMASAKVQPYLAGIRYPADKKQIIDHAQNMGARPEVVAKLEKLPEQGYETSSDVAKNLDEKDNNDRGDRDENTEGSKDGSK